MTGLLTKFYGPFAAISLLIIIAVGCRQAEHHPDRVLLIGIDGMSVTGFQKANLPNLDRLVDQGALSLKTRVVMPSVSAPNWASHLLGAGPEQHGVTANGWTVNNPVLKPAEADEQGFFPSLFSIIKDQKPEARTALFYDWHALADLFNPEDISRSEYSDTFLESVQKMLSRLPEEDPVFTFLYIGHPDEVGHEFGWGSKEYIRALEAVDTVLGKVLDTLNVLGYLDNTAVLVVTDHGGEGRGHGGFSMEEMEVPWLISGPGIIRDRLINQPNNVPNTAATIAYLLNLEPPPAWTGRPVLGAMEGNTASSQNTTAYVPQPYSSIPSGIYYESQAFDLSVKNKATIRFTLNGKDPDASSPVYKSPVLVQKSSVLKAAAFKEEHRSRITRIHFKKVFETRNISLSVEPAEKYAGSGAFTLVDRQLGSNDHLDGQWLGFRDVNPEIAIVLEKHEDVTGISLGFLSDPYFWIFPPKSITVLASTDGIEYRSIGSLDETSIQQRLLKGVNRVRIPIQPAKTRYLKLDITGPGNCPPGHPGEGQAAWLFLDEILIE